MSDFKFFFDTADCEYITKAWNKLSAILPTSGFLGVTTNPSAFDKVAIYDFKNMETRIKKIRDLVHSVRSDSLGQIYVQIPNSRMTSDQFRAFAKYLKSLEEGKCIIGMKIPPFKAALEMTEELSKITSINVTGVSDCAQALRSFSYPVDYVSLIPGRMEESGLDAKGHISFVQDRKARHAEVIAGSMRTLEQLSWTCKMNCVPTIGTKVWDMVLSQTRDEILATFRRDASSQVKQDYPPLTNQMNIDLALSFFEQMDGLGTKIAKELEAQTDKW